MNVGGWQSSDAILFWNAVALDAHRRDFTFTDERGEDETDAATDRRRLHPEHVGIPAAARILAMVHLAIYDAWCSLSPAAGPRYLLVRREQSPSKASVDAAVAGAAVAVLSGIYGRQHGLFDGKRREHLAMLSDSGVPSSALSAGYEHGRHIGLTMLEARRTDGSAVNGCHPPGDAPGQSRPDPFEPAPQLGPAWGDVEPFGCDAGIRESIRPPWGFTSPTGFLASAAYRQDVLEVASVGDADETGGRRTIEQTVVGLFWAYDGARDIGTAPRLYNQCVRTISTQCQLRPHQNALLFALVNMAMVDASIASWAAKSRYGVWRPIHGIREAAPGYGFSEPSAAAPVGDLAAGDLAAWLAETPSERASGAAAGWNGNPFWRPLGLSHANSPGEPHRTPSSPAYPSDHAAVGTACFDMAFRFLCTAAGRSAEAVQKLAFTFVSDEFNGRSIGADGAIRPRHVRTLTLGQAIRENALSRLYLGVNWRASVVEGARLGVEIVRRIAAHGRGPAAALLATPAAEHLPLPESWH